MFLDEIALMSPAFQGKAAARVLQEKTVIPLGGASAVPVDFRLVAATSRNLLERIEPASSGRISTTGFASSPSTFRRCASDRGHSCRWRRTSSPSTRIRSRPSGARPRLSAGARGRVEGRHPWKGNVRELENCIQRGSRAGARRGDPRRSPRPGTTTTAPGGSRRDLETLSYEEGKQEALKVFKRRFIERALTQSGGNVTHAADKCGLTRAAFQRIMRALDLELQPVHVLRGGSRL